MSPAAPDATTAPDVVPDGLYRAEALFAGWSATDPLSYRDTLDGRSYRRAVVEGLRTASSEAVARARALHDLAITRALDRAVVGQRVVAFVGGHQLERTSAPYRLVAECARSLTTDGFLVVSGGGPGAMEAAHLGARLAGTTPDALDEALATLGEVPGFPTFTGSELIEGDGTFDEHLLRAVHAWQVPAFAVAARWPAQGAPASVGIPTWMYGHEPPTPLASHHAKYFENSLREDGLLAVAKAGVVYAEGSAGTLQEVFQDAAQNFYRSVDDVRSPMVFLDLDEFWSVRRPAKLLLEGLFDEETEAILSFVDTAEAAADAIRSFPATTTPPLLRER